MNLISYDVNKYLEKWKLFNGDIHFEKGGKCKKV